MLWKGERPCGATTVVGYLPPDESSSFVEAVPKGQEEGQEESYLVKLGTLLHQDKELALSGLGGIGKSSLALHYAHVAQKHHLYDFIMWLNSENRETLIQDYRLLLQKWGCAESAFSTEETLVISLSNALKEKGYLKYLFVYDNIPYSEGFKGLFPQGLGHCLITSRCRLGWKQQLLLDVFSREESIDYLMRTTGIEDTQENRVLAGEIAEEVGHLPLALEHVRSYLQAMNTDLRTCSFASYLEEFRMERDTLEGYDFDNDESENEGLDHIKPMSGKSKKTVSKTWWITMNTISCQTESKKCQELMSYFAYLAPSNIPIALFKTDNKEEDKKIKSAIQLLSKYSMLKSTQQTVSVHRLVQWVTRQKQNQKNILRKLSKMFPKYIESFSPKISQDQIYQKSYDFLLHIESILSNFYKISPVSKNTSIFTSFLSLLNKNKNKDIIVIESLGQILVLEILTRSAFENKLSDEERETLNFFLKEIKGKLNFFDKIDFNNCHSFFQCALGTFYLLQRDFDNGKKWYLQAAQKNDAWAQFNLGTLLSVKCGSALPSKQSVFWSETTSDISGFSLTHLEKGLMFQIYTPEENLDNDKNSTDEEAAKWYEQAANQGLAIAQNNLGVMHLEGRGVEQGDEIAAKCYEQAANQGLAIAQNNLGVMYLQGRGVEQDDEIAAKWYEQAASQGLAIAQNNLGTMYLQGRGVEQSDEIAAKWYEQATNQSLAIAQNNLGVMYLQGRGAEQIDEIAAKSSDLVILKIIFRALEESDQPLKEGVLSLAVKNLSQDSLNHQNQNGETILFPLVRRDISLETLKTILEFHKFDVNLKNRDGNRLLDLVAQQGLPLDILSSLLDVGAYLVNDPQNMASYIQNKGRNEEKTTFADWAERLMDKVPQLRWHVMLDDLLPPLGRGVTGREIKTAHFGVRILPEAIEKGLFEEDGSFKKANENGLRTLGYIPWQGDHGLWLKILPELPGREEMARQLCLETLVKDKLHQPFVPPSTLMRVPCEGPWEFFQTEKKDLSCISVLISQNLGKQAFEGDPQCHKNLDSESLGWLFVLSLLLNPEDGKPDNYVVRGHPLKEDTFILSSIDNDRILVPPVALIKKSGPWGLKESKSLQVKTILYCLDQMKDPLDECLIKALKDINAEEILSQWLKGLGDYDEKLKKLFSEEERQNLYNQNSTILVPFAKGGVPELYRKFVRLQNVLKDNSERSFLEILVKVEPLLGKRYSQVLQQQELSPLERFKKIDGEDFSIAMNGSFETPVTANHPLKHFMRAISTCKDFHALIQKKQHLEAPKALEELETYVKKEKDLLNLGEGAEYKETDSNLIEAYLEKKSWEKISQATQQHLLSHMTHKAFRELYLANCQGLVLKDFQTFDLKNLTFLDVSGCRFVNDTFMSHVSRNCSALETLDISHTFLTAIQDKRGLSVKPFQAPSLTHLTGEACEIRFFYIEAPLLNYINIPFLFESDTILTKDSESILLNGKKLRNKGLNFLNNFTKLTSLNLKNNEISEEGLSHLTDLSGLEVLILEQNNLSSGIDFLNNFINLQYLDLSVCSLGANNFSFDPLSRLTNLKGLNLSNNVISPQQSNSLASLVNLELLNLANNNIGDAGLIFLSSLINLKVLALTNNNLDKETGNMLSKLTNLQYLDIALNNNLYENNIEYLSCLQNLSFLDVRHQPDKTKLATDGSEKAVNSIGTHFPNLSTYSMLAPALSGAAGTGIIGLAIVGGITAVGIGIGATVVTTAVGGGALVGLTQGLLLTPITEDQQKVLKNQLPKGCKIIF